MKFATHILLFGQEKWVMKNLENVYPHVDKIYAAYSELPWNYNPNARSQYKNTFDLNIIKNSKYADKIQIIEGVWDLDEQQRNSCLDAAKKDGMDFLFTIDADEFYFHNDLEKIKKIITDNPTYDFYRAGWMCFWKSFEHVLVDQKNNPILGYPEICVNLRKDNIKFVRCRIPSPQNAFTIPLDNGICFHGSYVLTDEEVLRKINTWGHAHQFNTYAWFNDVWKNWKESSLNLHPIDPAAWKQAIKFKGKLPEVLCY